MIRYVKHKDIDPTRWDACIRSAWNSRIYGYSWYLDAACQQQWDALILDDYSAVFPLPCRKRWTVHYVYTPFFIQHLGLFSQKSLSLQDQAEFLAAIPAFFRLVELNINFLPVAPIADFRFQPRRNIELSLQQPYEEIRARYSENTRRNLKTAERARIRVNEVGLSEAVIQLFRRERGRAIRHWKNEDYQRLDLLLEKCKTEQSRLMLEARSNEGEYLAGAVFLMTDQRAIFIFSATGQAARGTGAMTALIDTFIRDHAGKMTVLDFEGSEDPGLARFYNGFGAQETTYAMAIRNHLPKLFRLLKRIRK